MSLQDKLVKVSRIVFRWFDKLTMTGHPEPVEGSAYNKQRSNNMAIAKTEERIPARMPHEVYERIAEAAGTVGATLNQFIVQSALEKANNIMEQERTINLSAQAAKAVFDLLENPPQPSRNLKKALQYRKSLLCLK